MLFQMENFSRDAVVRPAVEQSLPVLTDEEFEAFERDYQSLAQRPLETSRVRAARRHALERLLARRFQGAPVEVSQRM